MPTIPNVNVSVSTPASSNTPTPDPVPAEPVLTPSEESLASIAKSLRRLEKIAEDLQTLVKRQMSN